jgi:hypothetical protein
MTLADEERLTLLLSRAQARVSDIQWRGVQRDATSYAALLVTGGMIAKGAGVFVPLVVMFFAAWWLQHDTRIGSNARYLREVIEPTYGDDVENFEEWLDRIEPARSYNVSWSFSATMARIYFPTLQLAGLVYALVHAATLHHELPLTICISAIQLPLIVCTFIKVKHVRKKTEEAP